MALYRAHHSGDHFIVIAVVLVAVTVLAHDVKIGRYPVANKKILIIFPAIRNVATLLVTIMVTYNMFNLLSQPGAPETKPYFLND